MLHPFSDLTPILPSATVHLPFPTVPGVPAFPDKPAAPPTSESPAGSVGTIVGVIVGILIIIIIVCGLVLLKYKVSCFLFVFCFFAFVKYINQSLFVLHLYVLNIQPIIYTTHNFTAFKQGWRMTTVITTNPSYRVGRPEGPEHIAGLPVASHIRSSTSGSSYHSYESVYPQQSVYPQHYITPLQGIPSTSGSGYEIPVSNHNQSLRF